MYLKVHRSPEGEVVAVCDADLLGTTLSHGDVQVSITGAFYGTERATEEEVRSALKNASNANLMGEKAVGIAIAMGLITEEGCISVGGVPHALIISI
ncbi:DUF424 domain-containing protein [Methanofollis fontis]|uniref:DUF424 domain-containing protein n=1 Tax=Methanofollis fontis TaxID=2052832 RepID=A0A483CYA7_9EURY|nr:DUF424 domain-containing protein [Methanofollis fontis]TAJ44576.1 DUF424 domain-containing protein [Methanofollis fontis]